MSPPQRALLTVCLLLLGAVVSAQTCGTSTSIRFKPRSDPSGISSYISQPGAPVNFFVSVALPTIVIQSLALDSTNSSLGYDFSMDGVTVSAATVPALRIGGNSVLLSRGEALFTALTIQEAPSSTTPTVIVFTVTTPAGKTLTITTGAINSVAVTSQNLPFAVRFANSGFFTRENQTREVPMGANLPQFALEIVNAGGQVITVSPQINVACSGCTVSQTVLVLQTVTGFQVSGATGNFSLTFTAFVGTWFGSVSTGSLMPVTLQQRNRFMRFDDTKSSILYENAGGTAVLGVPLPAVVIVLCDSQYGLDTSNTGLIITASCAQADLSGAQAIVKQGVATFTNLAFVNNAPPDAIIIFTAGTQGNLPVQGTTLSSGAFSVSLTAVKAKYLAFGPTSSLSETVPSYFVPVTSGQSQVFTIPQIVVQLKDSAHQIDSSASGFTLSVGLATGSSGVIAADASTLDASVSNGLAVWNNLQFGLSSSTGQSIKLTIQDKSVSSDQRSWLTTSTITIASNLLATAAAADKLTQARTMLTECAKSGSTTCVLGLRFASTYGAFSSSIFSATQQTFATVGVVIPTITVELTDTFGVSTSMPTASAPSVVAYTGDDPDGETLLVTTNQANYGTWQNGRYYFSCLQFVKMPTQPVRIKFMPIDNTDYVPALRYLGMNNAPLQTGFFSVAPSRTLAYGIQFSSLQSSFFLYEGQMSSVVVNVALPPITIDMVDSEGDFDSSDSTTFIVASTSSGTLSDDGTRVAVTNGRAVFSNLLFLSIADAPILTFTVHGRSGSTVPAIGSSISTGYLQATTLPIAAFEIDVMPSLSSNNIVTRQLQQIVFANLSQATVKVSIVVKNSAHETATSVSNVILITPHSDQATLDNVQSAKIDGTTACACANFTNTITGYQTGYTPGTPIFITYTVTTGTGLLLGKAVVIGPIAVNELDQKSSNCAANLVSPAVVGEFRMTPDVFASSTIRTDIAALMGIDGNRVNIPTSSIVGITRVDFSKLTSTWRGTKATIFFLDPPLNSINTRSGSELAAAFVALRPGCDATKLQLAAAYYQSDATQCDASQFEISKAETESCVALGILPLCQCYAQGVVADWGLACTEDPTVSSELSTICGKLTNCAEAGILTLCDIVASDSGTSLTWLWATIGSVGGLALIVVLLRRSGFVTERKKASLKNNPVDA